MSDRAWDRALLAIDLLARDPSGLGGIVLRARAGPVRDAARAAAAARLGPMARIAPGMAEDHVFGGLDLAATLAAGRPVRRPGLLAPGGAALLSMAERLPRAMAARLGQAVEARGVCLVALDEGASEEERPPDALAARLAFWIDLGEVSPAEVEPMDPAGVSSRAAAPRRPGVAEADLRALARAAALLGVRDGRAACLALRCAIAHAARAGRAALAPDDLEAATELVLAARATRLPAAEAEAETEVETSPGTEAGSEPDAARQLGPEPDRAPDRASAPEEGADGREEAALAERLVAAARAALPPDALARLASPGPQAAQAPSGGAAPVAKAGHRRGRPLPPRPGRPDGRARIDVAATLRRAAPWQRMRRAAEPGREGPILRASDIMLARAQATTDRLLVFVVDASGSAAAARLAEAKGAVELMLGAAYARRDHVAVVAFGGRGARTLLAPTRALARAKRALAGLPGGGGTPLAAGLRSGIADARAAAARGLAPSLIVLSDGRANLALDGAGDRARAAADALAMARAGRAARLGGLVIDTGRAPNPALAALSDALGAAYLPLPRADARAISRAVAGALGR